MNEEYHNKVEAKETKKNLKLILIIAIMLVLVAGSTFAYFAFRASNTIINGNAGTVQLTLNVTKVLPTRTGTDDVIVTSFSELPAAINSDCSNTEGDYALCQLYKVTISNAQGGVNTNIKGSISFGMQTTPNLSWILLGNSFNTNTTYTSSMLGDSFNTGSPSFVNFVNSYLLTAGSSIDYYILVWINESAAAQNDNGTYSGTVRFEDSNGKGVTSTFTS